jgi:predicted ATPase
MHLSLWTPHHTQRVIESGHVLISGAPGSGKSHLLREAIVPGLVAARAESQKIKDLVRKLAQSPNHQSLV